MYKNMMFSNKLYLIRNYLIITIMIVDYLNKNCFQKAQYNNIEFFVEQVRDCRYSSQ